MYLLQYRMKVHVLYFRSTVCIACKDEWTYSFGRFRVFEGYDFRNKISDQCASVLTMLQYTSAPYKIQKRIVEYE